MPNQTDTPAAETREHHPILDALRFCLAFWVVMSHGAIFPLFGGMDASARLGWTNPPEPFCRPTGIGFPSHKLRIPRILLIPNNRGGQDRKSLAVFMLRVD